MTDDPLEKAERVARVKGAAADMRRKEAQADEAEARARIMRERADGPPDDAGRVETRGRKSKFTQAAAERICAALEDGVSVRRAAAEEGVSHGTVIRWEKDGRCKIDGAPFSDRYAEARARGNEGLADLLRWLSEEVERVARTVKDKERAALIISGLKIRLDTVKWELSKRLPKEFGDRQAVELTGAGGKDLFPRMTDEERAASRARTAERRERLMRQLEDEIQEG